MAEEQGRSGLRLAEGGRRNSEPVRLVGRPTILRIVRILDYRNPA
jgi:hypothetical protein